MLIAALALGGLSLAAGFFPRLGAAAAALSFAYLLAAERTVYQNHYYLITLLAACLTVVPTHARSAVDGWLRPRSTSARAPAWCLDLFRGQIVLVYVFAGIAKMSPEWLSGWPVRLSLAVGRDATAFGPWFANEPAVALLTWGGLLADAVAGPLLLVPRARRLALPVLAAFHLGTALFWGIGVFPWLMLAALTLFLPPAWPRSLAARLCGRALAELPEAHPPPGPVRRAAILAGLAVYASIQVVLPLRHWVHPGPVDWTDEGRDLAWRMKLTVKQGVVGFAVTVDGLPLAAEVDPVEHCPRAPSAMATSPELIRQCAHGIAGAMRARGYSRVEVRATSLVQLDFRRPQPLVDPAVDLAAVPPGSGYGSWIVPLREPLPDPAGFWEELDRRRPRPSP